MVRLDLCYIRDWSLMLDLRILIKPLKLFSGHLEPVKLVKKRTGGNHEDHGDIGRDYHEACDCRLWLLGSKLNQEFCQSKRVMELICCDLDQKKKIG